MNKKERNEFLSNIIKCSIRNFDRIGENLAEQCVDYLEQLETNRDEAIEKIELLLKDLKLNQEEEKATGKSYFNTNLFAIRVNEILKILKANEVQKD